MWLQGLADGGSDVFWNERSQFPKMYPAWNPAVKPPVSWYDVQAIYNQLLNRFSTITAMDIPGMGPFAVNQDGSRLVSIVQAHPELDMMMGYENGGGGEMKPMAYKMGHSFLDKISPEILAIIVATILTAGIASGAIGGAGSGVVGAEVGAGGFTIPTTAELAANGFVPGMGITGGAGSIGSAASLVEAGIGGSVGYGSGAVALGLGTGGGGVETLTNLTPGNVFAPPSLNVPGTGAPTLPGGIGMPTLNQIGTGISLIKTVMGAIAKPVTGLPPGYPGTQMPTTGHMPGIETPGFITNPNPTQPGYTRQPSIVAGVPDSTLMLGAGLLALLALRRRS